MINDMKKKSDFIVELLSSESLSQKQRLQILELSIEEINQSLNLQSENSHNEINNPTEIIRKRLENIEVTINDLSSKEDSKKILEVVNQINIKLGGTTLNSLENNYPIFHCPSKTVDLLNYFTLPDKSLKYTTHSWEDGKFSSYQDFMQKIIIEWKEIEQDLKKQSKRLHAKISNFLFNDKLGEKNNDKYPHNWGEKRLSFGWSSPELKLHMSQIGMSPFSYHIPKKIRLLDSKFELPYFSDYTEAFKNEIECREDSKNLKNIVLKLWENELSYDFTLEGIEVLDSISFFTDVHVFKECLRKIFLDSFKRRPMYQCILIEKESVFENKGYHIIRFIQKDSQCSRSVDDPKIKNPTGDFIDIISKLENLADYSIESLFGDGKSYRVNYLTSNPDEGQKIEIPEGTTLKGFTHEFKFYL